MKLTREQQQLVADSMGVARYAAGMTGPLTSDNVSIAYLALCRAAATYVHDKGMTWESYARCRVRGDLLDAWRVAGGWRRKRVADPSTTTASEVDEIAELEDLAFARWLLDTFDDRAQAFVRRWCAGETMAAIATSEGISERRVGQIIGQRLRHLRELAFTSDASSWYNDPNPTNDKGRR